MTRSVVRAGVDVWLSSTSPTKNYGLNPRLRLKANENEALIRFRAPFPRGATILSAKLVLTQCEAFSGSVTVSAQRYIAGWMESAATWNREPRTGNVAGAVATMAKSSPGAGTVWEIPLTSQMVDVAAGSTYHGIRLWSSSASLLRFWSLDAGSLQPYLVVEWTTGPSKPSLLKPNGGVVNSAKPVLATDFTDHLGSTSMQAIQVQIDAANDFTTGIDFDSGTVTTSTPQLDLATTAYAGMAEGATTYWRCRVRDGDGIWSPWSDSASMTRFAKGVVTVTSPGAGPEMYRNLYPTPSFETTESWTAQSGSNDPVRSTEQAWIGTWSVKCSRGAGTAAVYGFHSIASLLTAGAGTYRISMQVWIPSAISTAGTTGILFGGTGVTTTPVDTDVRDQWVELTTTVTWNGSGTVTLQAYDTNLTAGGFMYIDGIVVTSGSTYVPFFYGDSVDTYPGEFSWAGTANNSQSIRYDRSLVEDLTPTFTWSFAPGAGESQTHWQVRIARSDNPKHYVHDTGKQAGTITSYTVPKNVLADDTNYRLWVHCWDTKYREATADDPVYGEHMLEFRMKANPLWEVPSNVQVTQARVDGVGPLPPWVEVSWTFLGTPPAAWSITRDGKPVDNDLDAADVTRVGTTFKYVDSTARPGVNHTWTVRAKVNGSLSQSASKTYMPQVEGIWVFDPLAPTTKRIVLAGTGFDAESDDLAETYQILGSPAIVRTVMGLTGLSGTVRDAVLYSETGVPSLTWDAMEAIFYGFKSRPTDVFRLVMADLNIPVVLGDMKTVPHPETLMRRIQKLVSFSWWQYGEFPFDGEI